MKRSIDLTDDRLFSTNVWSNIDRKSDGKPRYPHKQLPWDPPDDPDEPAELNSNYYKPSDQKYHQSIINSITRTTDGIEIVNSDFQLRNTSLFTSSDWSSTTTHFVYKPRINTHDDILDTFTYTYDVETGRLLFNGESLRESIIDPDDFYTGNTKEVSEKIRLRNILYPDGKKYSHRKRCVECNKCLVFEPKNATVCIDCGVKLKSKHVGFKTFDDLINNSSINKYRYFRVERKVNYRERNELKYYDDSWDGLTDRERRIIRDRGYYDTDINPIGLNSWTKIKLYMSGRAIYGFNPKADFKRLIEDRRRVAQEYDSLFDNLNWRSMLAKRVKNL